MTARRCVRGGAGLYWETELLWRRLQERAAIGPVGNGRLQVPHTSFINIFPGIINLNTGLPVAVGAALPASGQVTNMTVGQFMQIYNAQIGALQAQLAPQDLDDLSVRNIQLGKTATDLYPLDYPVQHSPPHEHRHPARAARQHGARRRAASGAGFDDTLLGSLDLNRFNRFVNGVQTPVIPRCTTAADQRRPERAVLERHRSRSGRRADARPTTGCSSKLDKRFSNRYLFGVVLRADQPHHHRRHQQPRQLLRQRGSDRRAAPAERVGAVRSARATSRSASSRRWPARAR